MDALVEVARVPCLASHYPGGGSRHVCSLIIQELAAACLANMLCGVDDVRHAVLRLGGDRILREFLTSPTATVQVRGCLCVYRCMAPLACVFHSYCVGRCNVTIQNMVAKHACRALANLFLGWASLVCAFEVTGAPDEWHAAKAAAVQAALDAHTGARDPAADSAGAGVQEEADDAGGAGGGRVHSVIPMDLKQRLKVTPGSWLRLASDVREPWRAVRDKWTTWHSA